MGGTGTWVAALAALALSGCGFEPAVAEPDALPRGFHRRIDQGLAISLNQLSHESGSTEPLPGMAFHGVLVDHRTNDWLLFGDSDPTRPGIPRDAIAIAARVIRLGMRAPGVDIRPPAGDPGSAEQVVSYFPGSLTGTWAGRVFFDFDVYMKRAAHNAAPIPIPGARSYAAASIARLEEEVATCSSHSTEELSRQNRFWLCADRIGGLVDEENDALTFDGTTLRVLAEGANAARAGGASGSPCSSAGTDDPLAAEFATALDQNLALLNETAPVREIEDFARLIAAFVWLMHRDPEHDLQPWLDAPLTPWDTPGAVSTAIVKETREHSYVEGNTQFVHSHTMEIAGGVHLSPIPEPEPVEDDSLLQLSQSVIGARPSVSAEWWTFQFDSDHPTE